MMRFLNRFYPFIVIAVGSAILFWANYAPGTYLVGWDNVMPEMNFSANIWRSLFSVWQEYRGLGVVDGMAHAANLVHTVFILLLSFVFPTSSVRYIFHILMHFLGGIGMYCLLRALLAHSGKQENSISRQLLPLSGALFYQYNLATVQMFYAPLEVFSIHFAFLPLLLWRIEQYMSFPVKRNLLWFALVSFLSLGQAHVPSVFLVYAVAAAILIVSRFLFAAGKRRTFRHAAAIVLVSVGINAYWGLPYIYTTRHAASTITQSKINQMGTDNIVLRNKEFGNFKSVALLWGFSFDYVDYQPTGENGYMMAAWRTHITHPAVFTLSWLLFILAGFGWMTILSGRKKALYPYSVMTFLTFLLLGSDIPVLGFLATLLQDNVPLFYQVFRFTFTKFSILYVAGYSICLTVGIQHLFMALSPGRVFRAGTYAVFFAGLCVISFPSWQGFFFYPNLRVPIPNEYGELVTFFRSRDQSTRIAVLPQPSYWGWNYYRWGVRGSGFIWYGLPQPSMDGAFYPWSRQNENYYWEMTYAIYSANVRLLENVMEKYQIQYIVVDHSLISPFSPKAVYGKPLTDLLQSSPRFRLLRKLGKLDVYSVDTDIPVHAFTAVLKDMPRVEPVSLWNDLDRGFVENKYYVSRLSTAPDETTVWYPFRSVFSGRSRVDQEFTIEEKDDTYIFSTTFPQSQRPRILDIPALTTEETSEFSSENLGSATEKLPRVRINGTDVPAGYQQSRITVPQNSGGTLEVVMPKMNGIYSYNSENDETFLSQVPKNCEPDQHGVFLREPEKERGKNFFRFTSVGANNCLDIDLSPLSQRLGYVISVQSRNREGKSFLFSLYNKHSERADLETYLPANNDFTTDYYIQPPLEYDAFGYTAQINSASIGRQKAVNDLVSVTLNPFPYRFLTGITLKGEKVNGIAQHISRDGFATEHPHPGYYQVEIRNSEFGIQNTDANSFLILSQAYDDGWKSYEVTNDWLTDSWYMKLLIPVFGRELKGHVLVNNWENGWSLPTTKDQRQTTTIAIIYLPQYLEYAGFALLVIGAVFLWRFNGDKHNHNSVL